MSTLLLAGLSNALVASGLAVIAFTVGRVWKKQPALAHSLWLLVLLKLLTPPIVTIPFEWTVRREVAAAPREPVRIAALDALPYQVVYGAAPYTGQLTFENPPLPNTLETTFREGLLDPMTGKPMLVIEVKPSTVSPPMPAPVKPEMGVQTAEPVAAPLVAIDNPAPIQPASPLKEEGVPWLSVIFIIWWVGAIGWFVFALWRIARFHRLLRNATAPEASFQEEFVALARRMGFRKPPALRILPGAVTPLVWAVGKAKVYFPAQLLQQLDASQRASLFVHELAHLKRRDHWVRWVELIAVSLYWWLPVSWFARRQLQRVEEECCDSWVVEMLPGSSKSYAAALLDTMDFLAEVRPAPALASGVGRVPSIQKRLLMILNATPHRRPTFTAKLATALCALAFLPLAPTLAQKIVEVEKPRENPGAADASATSDEDKSPKVVTPFEPFAYENRSTVLQSPKSSWWTIVVSPDNKTIATTLGRGGSHPGEVQFWDLQTGKLKKSIKLAGTVRCMAYSPDGKFFATGSFDNAVRIHDAETGQILAHGFGATGGHNNGVNAVSFNGDGTLLATAGLDNTARLWDVAEALRQQRQEKGNQIITMGPVVVFQGHGNNPVYSVALSKDGKTLLTGCRDGIARLFDVPKILPKQNRQVVKQERVAFKGHTNAIETVAFSPDEKLVATASWDATAKLWDRDGKLIHTLQGHTQGVMALAFSKDGKKIATCSGDNNNPTAGEVKLWDTETGNKVNDLGRHKALVSSVVFTGGDALVWSLGRDGSIQGWPMAGAGEARTLVNTSRNDEFDQAILAVSLSKDGKTLAVAGDSKNIVLWNLESNTIIGILQGHTDVVNGVAFSPDGKTLASASNDKTIILWDMASKSPRQTLKGHKNWVFSVAFSLDGASLASGSYDKTVRIWDLATNSEKAAFQGHSAAIRSVSFSPLGDYLASGSSDRTVRVWPLKEKKEPLVLRGHKGAIRSIAFSPDGATIASGSEDMMIKIWGIAEAKEILQIGPTSDMVGGIAFSPRGSMIISGSWNGSTQVWDAQTGKQRANLNGHSDAVVAVAVSSDAQSLVTASMDKTIRLWPATAPPPAAQLTFVGHTAALWSVAVSPDRKTLATAGKDGAIRLWDAATTKFIGRLAGHQSGVTHLSFSSDGKTLLSAGKDKLARIWDVEKREEKLALTHHTGEVTRAIFSPNGQVIATASTDKVVRLFDPTTGKLIRELPAHDATVSALAFNKDGSQLASGGNDKVMILWNVATGAIVQRTPVNFNLGQIHAVAFTPDGKNIALAHNQDYRQPMDDDQGDPQWRNVAMWNLEKGAFIESVAQYQHSDWITAIGFSAGGDMMITTSRDGMVRFWELATHKLHQSFRAHQANIAALAVSSDGEALFTAGDDRLARRWSAIPRMPLTERARITGQTGRVRFSVLSPDGKLVATGGDDKAIRLRSTSLGAHVVMQSQAGAAYCVTFSPDNKYVVSGHEHGQVRVSDPVTGKEIKRLDAKDQRVWGLAFSKDGKYLVGVTGNWSDKEAGGVLVWTVADWKLQHTLAGHSDLVFSVSFSPDGRRFATGSRDNTVRIWDAVDGSCLRTLDLHKGAVRSVAWSGDNATLASVGFDNHLILWDTTTWKVRVDREYQGKGLCRVAFSPNSKILAIGYNTSDARIGHVILCDAVTNAEQHTLNGHTGQLLDLAFAANGQYIVTTGGRYGAQIENSPNDNAPARTLDDEDVVERPQAGAARIGKQAEIKCWNVQSGGKLVDLAGPQFWVEGVALSRDGHHIATAGGNEGKPGEVRVWETTGIQLKVALKGHEASASSAAFNPDGTLMATGGADKVVIIWDLKKALTLGGWGPEGVIKHTLRGHVMGVQKVRFTPDGKWVVSAGEDGVVKIWNVETGELARTISAHSMTINSLAMSPDGKTLATTANDWKNRKPSEIRFWDFDTGNEKFRLPDQRANVQDIAFSHDGKKFITAEQGENQVQIWDLTAQRVIKKLQASAPARCIAVTKDGRHLAVGTARGQVQVWDTTTWEELSVLKGHAQNRNVLDVNFAHDGSILVSAGGDATAGIWNMPMNRK